MIFIKYETSKSKANIIEMYLNSYAFNILKYNNNYILNYK